MISRAWEPVWTVVDSTVAVPASQVHGVRAPDSKPGLASRLPEAGVLEGDGEGDAEGEAEWDGEGEGEGEGEDDGVPVEPLVYGSAMIVMVRSCTPQASAWVPGSQTSTVSFWIHVADVRRRSRSRSRAP